MIALVESPLKSNLNRQIRHWDLAIDRISDLNLLASQEAWRGVEKSLGEKLKSHLNFIIKDLKMFSNRLIHELSLAKNDEDFRKLNRELLELRNKYLKAETTIHFFTDALNTRTNDNIACLLRACDALCMRSMNELLIQLGKTAPPVLTYLDKGVGASIMKAGLKLWDGNISPIACIKVTFHNLYRPTAIIHETGHQVAHILGWKEEIEKIFYTELFEFNKKVAGCFALWSSEIVADVFAFVHTGYAAVAALHDVVCGEPGNVFFFNPRDPHPISYIRVLLNIEFCKLSFGLIGPWMDLENSFKQIYDVDLVLFESVPLIKDCVRLLPKVAQICLKKNMVCFKNKSISELINTDKLKKSELNKIINTGTEVMLNSASWISKNSMELLAISGYKIATEPSLIPHFSSVQEKWMLKLGNTIEMN